MLPFDLNDKICKVSFDTASLTELEFQTKCSSLVQPNAPYYTIVTMMGLWSIMFVKTQSLGSLVVFRVDFFL